MHAPPGIQDEIRIWKHIPALAAWQNGDIGLVGFAHILPNIVQVHSPEVSGHAEKFQQLRLEEGLMKCCGLSNTIEFARFVLVLIGNFIVTVLKILKIPNERILQQLLPMVDFIWGVPLHKVRYHLVGHVFVWKVYSETLHNLWDSEAFMIEHLADHAAKLSQIGLSDERPCLRRSGLI